MRLIADLHLHSKYSRSCSKDLELENIDRWCQLKGIDVIGTADFTHPAWIRDIKNKLTEAEPGLYKLKNENSTVRFILTTELSCIYKQGDKVRRIHLCILAPSIKTVEEIIKNFEARGFNLKSDGRPILGISAKELTKIILTIDPRAMVIPAHAWTPWFAVFGSKSGFDSLEECFEEMTPHIYAIETGLSSDPPMNWQWSKLDHLTLISNSDAHSLSNLGREANVFEIDKNNLSYDEIYRIIKTGDKNNFLYTIEFFPEEGKYHFDGHANCHYSCNPEVSKKNNNLCPICSKPLILGVMHRTNDLADKKNNKINHQNRIPYKHIIPLQEIIADNLGVGKNSKKVKDKYFNLIKQYSEFQILLDLNINDLKKITDEETALGIVSMRAGKVKIEPGYDGLYGKIKIDNSNKLHQATK